MTPWKSPQVDEFARILGARGVLPALQFLNARVEHRCTAVYRLEQMTVRNIYLYDREGALLPESLGTVPLGNSFCQYALRDGAFLSDDSRADRRLDGNPFQGVVVAYHGIPLMDNSGQLYGTLCHFDFVPRSLSDAEFEFLHQAARILPSYL